MVKTKKKKSSKVKIKRVECKKTAKKKKKTTKKKTTKKKTTKKKTTKKKTTKKKKKTKRKKIAMDDIYTIINKVQLGKKEVTFATQLQDAPTIENNIKDVGLEYKKAEMKTQVVFTLYPNDEKYEDEIDNLHFEIMDDEIPDIGQIFG